MIPLIISILLLSYLYLNILDMRLTNRILNDGGYEMNPIIRLFQARNKQYWHISKFILIIVSCIFIIITSAINILFGLFIAIVCNIIYLLIVMHNFYQIKTMEKEY